MPKQKDKSTRSLVSAKNIHQQIYPVRGHKVILDFHLASVYGIPTFRLNEAVKRNRRRFPSDFIFQLTKKEYESLISQIAMSKTGRGGRRTLPYAFTEHGALMAANVLNSPRAVQMSVYVIRAFVRMREAFADNQILHKRLAEIETVLLSHDGCLRDLYKKIQPLLAPPIDPPRRRIGFHP